MVVVPSQTLAQFRLWYIRTTRKRKKKNLRMNIMAVSTLSTEVTFIYVLLIEGFMSQQEGRLLN
jgi:hypothetical protein